MDVEADVVLWFCGSESVVAVLVFVLVGADVVGAV